MDSIDLLDAVEQQATSNPIDVEVGTEPTAPDPNQLNQFGIENSEEYQIMEQHGNMFALDISGEIRPEGEQQGPIGDAEVQPPAGGVQLSWGDQLVSNMK